MSGQRYTEEFKIEAIRQVVDRGYSIAKVFHCVIAVPVLNISTCVDHDNGVILDAN